MVVQEPKPQILFPEKSQHLESIKFQIKKANDVATKRDAQYQKAISNLAYYVEQLKNYFPDEYQRLVDMDQELANAGNSKIPGGVSE